MRFPHYIFIGLMLNPWVCFAQSEEKMVPPELPGSHQTFTVTTYENLKNMQKALIKASQETETMSLTCNEFNCNLWEAAKIFCKLVPSLTQTLKLQTSLTRIGIDIGLRTNWVCADGIALI